MSFTKSHVNFSDTNITRVSFLQPNSASPLFHIVSYLRIPFVLIGVLANIEILITFIRRPRLITPFTIYILNLAIINLSSALVYEPFAIVRYFYREVSIGNKALCGFVKYCQWTTDGITRLQHGLICFDRWLAVLLPTWYRLKPVSFGVKVTLLALLYHQIWYIPLLIVDQVQGVVTPTTDCGFTLVLPQYQMVVRTMTMYIPFTVLFGSYPLLFYKILKRRHLVIPENQLNPARTKQRSQELGMTMGLLLIYFIFVLPILFTSALKAAKSPIVNEYFAVTELISRVLYVIEPYLYLVFMSGIREEVKRHLRQLASCCVTPRQAAQPI
ncbi:hypothetical protein BV898_02077 [Hypsibius exemplaris]|uniref:G-protein coupled receptors family 1 profile domain-containing protein n=1 Tax=Hypsibius exemplaris TaxID=2072580 RepID=A0A1W0X9B0_HYPEX|nr:hypothetical protein BV898_02077 [Hypsibius exemplaris]